MYPYTYAYMLEFIFQTSLSSVFLTPHIIFSSVESPDDIMVLISLLVMVHQMIHQSNYSIVNVRPTYLVNYSNTVRIEKQDLMSKQLIQLTTHIH